MTPEDQHDRYVGSAISTNGLPANPTLKVSDDYDLVNDSPESKKKPGISFKLALLDEHQEKTGKKVLVHLDWFKPKNVVTNDPRRKVGIGYKTVNEPDEGPDYCAVRYAPTVYAVYLKHGSKQRFYVVFLPKGEQGE